MAVKMNVSPKQLVHVLALGAGQVTKVFPDGSFDVKIGGYGEPHFTPDGCLGQSDVRRVYYQDPIVIEPPDNPRLWAAFKRLAAVVYAELDRLDREGGISDSILEQD